MMNNGHAELDRIGDQILQSQAGFDEYVAYLCRGEVLPTVRLAPNPTELRVKVAKGVAIAVLTGTVATTLASQSAIASNNGPSTSASTRNIVATAPLFHSSEQIAFTDLPTTIDTKPIVYARAAVDKRASTFALQEHSQSTTTSDIAHVIDKVRNWASSADRPATPVLGSLQQSHPIKVSSSSFKATTSTTEADATVNGVIPDDHPYSFLNKINGDIRAVRAAEKQAMPSWDGLQTLPDRLGAILGIQPADAVTNDAAVLTPLTPAVQKINFATAPVDTYTTAFGGSHTDFVYAEPITYNFAAANIADYTTAFKTIAAHTISPHTTIPKVVPKKKHHHAVVSPVTRVPGIPTSFPASNNNGELNLPRAIYLMQQLIDDDKVSSPAEAINPVTAAGYVGNFGGESGPDFNPGQQQHGGGPGMGEGQWEMGGRWDTTPGDNMIAFCRERGLDPYNASAQMKFVIYEIHNVAPFNQTQQDLIGVTSPAEAAKIVEQKYEIAGVPALAGRESNADQVYAAYMQATGQQDNA